MISYTCPLGHVNERKEVFHIMGRRGPHVINRHMVPFRVNASVPVVVCRTCGIVFLGKLPKPPQDIPPGLA